jgi:hypothetical protein
MKWYIIVKAFFVVYATVGPYDSEQECKDMYTIHKAEALQRYNAGERLHFLGKEINPNNVKATCQRK